MLKKIGALALTGGFLMWSGAAAADNCHHGRFNGLYIGASVGYAGLDSEQSPRGEPKLSSDDGSVIAGGHLGYNVQCGHLVFGVEGDINFVDLSSHAVQPDLTSFQSSIDWLATLRGRLGMAVREDVLIYATAGVAFADRTHSLHAPGAPGGPFSQSDGDTATGWVIGGGVEFIRHDRWVLRGEVLWADLGSESRTYVTGACGVLCEAHAGWDDEMLIARVGLSLKLGGHEAHYEPLK